MIFVYFALGWLAMATLVSSAVSALTDPTDWPLALDRPFSPAWLAYGAVAPLLWLVFRSTRPW